MEVEGSGIGIGGREARGFARLLLFTLRFQLLDSGTGATVFVGVGVERYAFVTVAFGVDMVC
jgi:hypothetical protein